MSRPLPWDLLAPVAAGYAGLGDQPANLATFARAPAVQRLLEQVGAPDLMDREPLAAAEYLHLLFADWMHWKQERPVTPVTRAALDAMSSRSPLPAHRLVLTYLQLPPRLFWLQPGDGVAHEPLDGCYVIPLDRDELLVVAILGLHAGRTGFSQVTVTARQDDLRAAAAALPATPFAPAMAGGAAAGMRSVPSVAELLHLVRLALTPHDA